MNHEQLAGNAKPWPPRGMTANNYGYRDVSLYRLEKSLVDMIEGKIQGLNHDRRTDISILRIYSPF